MNKIVLLITSITISFTIFFILYLIPYFSKKKIREGKFDIFQFIKLFFSPILIIPILYFLYQIISSNPERKLIYLPRYFSELLFLLLLYFLILGNGIHSVAVVLSKHMKKLTKHKVWEITEFFHHQFSHFLINASGSLILFSYVIMEINHPNNILLNSYEITIVIISGVLTGIISGLAAIESRVPQSMFFIYYVLSIIIPFIFIRFSLDFRFFPFSSFIETLYISAVLTISAYKYKKKGFPEIVPPYFFED